MAQKPKQFNKINISISVFFIQQQYTIDQLIETIIPSNFAATFRVQIRQTTFGSEFEECGRVIFFRQVLWFGQTSFPFWIGASKEIKNWLTEKLVYREKV